MSSSYEAKTGVLLIHGLTGSPTEMKVVARHLEELGYATETPLLAGHGKGNKELIDTTAEQLIESVKSSFDAACKKWEQVFVVGLCASSTLAGLLAADDSRVKGVALLSTHYGKFNPAISARQKLLPLAFKFPRALRTRIYWTETPPYGIKDQRMQDVITAAIKAAKGKRETEEHGTFRTYVETLYQSDRLVKLLKTKANKIKCPTLFIHSMEDTWFTYQNSIDLCNDIPSMEKSVLLINNCNHVLTVDLMKHEVSRQVALFVENYAKSSGERTSSIATSEAA